MSTPVPTLPWLTVTPPATEPEANSGFAAARSDASVRSPSSRMTGPAWPLIARPLDAEGAATGATDDEAAEADVQGGWLGPRWSGA
eukprot:9493065-Pyramimonas_sp.AAC.1